MPHILWSLATVVGVIALLLVMVHVIRKNKQSDVPLERTEQATHDLYAEADKKDGEA